MSTAKTVAGIVPGVMAVGLLGESVKMIPSKKQLKGKGKVKPHKMIKGFTKIIVGVPLISATSKMVNVLP